MRGSLSSVLKVSILLYFAISVNASVVTVYKAVPSPTPTVDDLFSTKATNIVSAIGTASDVAATTYEWKYIPSEIVGPYSRSPVPTNTLLSEPITFTYTVVQGAATHSFTADIARFTQPVNALKDEVVGATREECTITATVAGVPLASCVAEVVDPTHFFWHVDSTTTRWDIYGATTKSLTYEASMVPIATITQSTSGSLSVTPPTSVLHTTIVFSPVFMSAVAGLLLVY